MLSLVLRVQVYEDKVASLCGVFLGGRGTLQCARLDQLDAGPHHLVGSVFCAGPSWRWPRGGAMSPVHNCAGGAGEPALPWGGEGAPHGWWRFRMEPPLLATDVWLGPPRRQATLTW